MRIEFAFPPITTNLCALGFVVPIPTLPEVAIVTPLVAGPPFAARWSAPCARSTVESAREPEMTPPPDVPSYPRYERTSPARARVRYPPPVVEFRPRRENSAPVLSTLKRACGVLVPMPMFPVESVVPVPEIVVPKMMLPMLSWLLAVADGASMFAPTTMLFAPVVTLSPAW